MHTCVNSVYAVYVSGNWHMKDKYPELKNQAGDISTKKVMDVANSRLI